MMKRKKSRSNKYSWNHSQTLFSVVADEAGKENNLDNIGYHHIEGTLDLVRRFTRMFSMPISMTI